MTPDRRPKRPVETVETCFEILEFLLENGQQSLTEISDAVGRAPSTVHRHLKTLRYLGYVIREDSKFMLSLHFLEYGTLVQNAQQVYDVGRHQADIVSEETGERTRLSKLESGLNVLLYQRQGSHQLETSSYVGQRRLAHTLAGGKAMFAQLDRQEVEAIIDTHGLEGVTEQTITSKQVLFEELEETRERGYALNLEEALPGLNAVGAAISNEEGRPIGALSISGPANRLNRSYLEGELATELMGAVNEAEIKIKYAQS